VEEPWCEFTVCPNPDCAQVLKAEGAKSLFGKNVKCPHCGREWIPTWAHYKKCSEEPDWHLMAFQEFYKGQTTLAEFYDHQSQTMIGVKQNDN